MIPKIFSGRAPFSHKTNENAIMMAISQGQRPIRHSSLDGPVWKLINQCWHQNANDRPLIDEVVNDLSTMPNITRNASCVNDWEQSSVSELRKALIANPFSARLSLPPSMSSTAPEDARPQADHTPRPKMSIKPQLDSAA
jgi:hypothetical protein